MRFAIPLLAALAMITLVACGGGDDETVAPLPLEQRFVTAEDAPGPPGSVSEEQALDIASAYYDRLTGS